MRQTLYLSQTALDFRTVIRYTAIISIAIHTGLAEAERSRDSVMSITAINMIAIFYRGRKKMSTETPHTMKAIQIHAFGGPEVLVYEDVARPTAGPGEVLIRVSAAGLYPGDWY